MSEFLQKWGNDGMSILWGISILVVAVAGAIGAYNDKRKSRSETARRIFDEEETIDL